MDVKAYIESGILEQYALGWLSESESRQVEEVVQKYPEVRRELQEIEIAMGQMAQVGAIPPQPDTKEALFDRIRRDKFKSLEDSLKTKIHGLQRERSILMALLALAALLIAWFVYQNSRHMDQLNAAVTGNRALAAACDSTTAERDRLAQYFQFLQDTATRAIPMKGTKIAPLNALTVYYNPIAGQTLLSIGHLPAPPSDRSYQLWALVDGKPVDMGVLTIPSDTTYPLVVPFIAEAGAFAITLEPRGGSVNPTLDQMQALGSVGI